MKVLLIDFAQTPRSHNPGVQNQDTNPPEHRVSSRTRLHKSTLGTQALMVTAAPPPMALIS